MVENLNKQVYLYSLDTSAFYSDEEYKIHNKMLKLYRIRNCLKLEEKKHHNEIYNISNELREKDTRYKKLLETKRKVNKKIGKYKEKLTNEIDKNRKIRNLRDDSLKENKIIGMFDSALTRTIGMKVNEVSNSLFVVRVYYYQILQSLIDNGFMHNGEKYIYFSSSAGQIRTKKAVFIKEALWNVNEGSLTCGLSLEEINEKGGCNINKLLAYKALTASASIEWKDFKIDRAIVVPDLETNVNAMFDYFDRNTYEVAPKNMSVPIEHTDGCGMILPEKSKRSFMVRLPYVKGLLVPFSFDKFAKEFNSTKVKDIYNKEWDIIEDQIQVIFTASQFKMKKFYDNWSDYKKRFKENKCQAVKLNEEDIGENATLNYQMLQTITDATSQELNELAKLTIDDISNLGTDKEVMLRVLGATEANQKKNYYQQALLMYPEMLNDEHSKKIIKDKKKALVKDARSAKLRINGKYTYIVPDLYAFCERLFLNKEKPTGLLRNGEVCCTIYDKGKLDILRSPHLYKEHCIRENIHSDTINKWFITKGIYTSIHDPISRILQFDNDGDKALVVQDDILIRMAERNMKDILPLFYEMESAKAELISKDKVYSSLLLAFKANIGEVSNNITKIFNSKNPDIRVVKWLTAENNYIIDFAKSLYMPKRPEWANKVIKKSIASKVPYFFIDAKDKHTKSVEPLNNSTVNKLRKIIPNKRVNFREVAGDFNYKNLMSEEVKYTNKKIVDEYRRLDRYKKFIIREVGIKNRNEGLLYVYKHIRKELKKIEQNEEKIVNILVHELYAKVKSPYKTTLWSCYGDILLANLRGNLKNMKQCVRCGSRFEIVNSQSKYCEDCSIEIKREKIRERVRKYRKKHVTL
ncbi:hypothetical protein V1503_18955 [Bacillus sp. SCS-151]|uniref:hypothetical protein n=1 Tax=Nanhaiella sioensis TaxID=3115293 RepID=UPI00397ABFDD